MTRAPRARAERSPAILCEQGPSATDAPARLPIIRDGRTDTGALTVSCEIGWRLLGLGRSSFYNAVKNGEIKSVKIGARVLIPCAEIERLLSVAVAA